MKSDPDKKFWALMVGILMADMLLFLLLSKFYMPTRGTHMFKIMKNVAFTPFIVVSIMQLCKLLINIKNGYVVTGAGLRLIKWHLDKSPFLFFFGIFTELAMWGIIGISVLKFLLRTN